MASRRLGPGELLAGASGLLLLLALFLPWFGLDGRVRVPGTGEAITVEGRSVDAWEAFGAIDLVLVAVAVIAVTLPVVALRATPPRALVDALTGAATLAALLIVYRLIDVPEIPVEEEPGDTAYETGRRLGTFFGLLCTAGIAWGASLVRAQAAATERAPAAPPARPPTAPPAPAPVARPAPA